MWSCLFVFVGFIRARYGGRRVYLGAPWCRRVYSCWLGSFDRALVVVGFNSGSPRVSLSSFDRALAVVVYIPARPVLLG